MRGGHGRDSHRSGLHRLRSRRILPVETVPGLRRERHRKVHHGPSVRDRRTGARGGRALRLPREGQGPDPTGRAPGISADEVRRRRDPGPARVRRRVPRRRDPQRSRGRARGADLPGGQRGDPPRRLRSRRPLLLLTRRRGRTANPDALPHRALRDARVDATAPLRRHGGVSAALRVARVRGGLLGALRAGAGRRGRGAGSLAPGLQDAQRRPAQEPVRVPHWRGRNLQHGGPAAVTGTEALVRALPPRGQQQGRCRGARASKRGGERAAAGRAAAGIRGGAARTRLSDRRGHPPCS